MSGQEVNEKKGMTYAGAGVDIDAAEGMIPAIKRMARSTHVLGAGEIGGFGAAFNLGLAGVSSMKEPILLSSTDGVGTKLQVAFMADAHNTVGIDLVAMCANDVVVQGAKVLFFLDYFATGRLKPGVALDVIGGITEGCRQSGCALIGGETAEMPGAYPEGEYDLAGFAVGIVEKNKMIDGSSVRDGDQLIGVASSGLHSNGYSLVREVAFAHLRMSIGSYVPDFGKTLGEELLIPTKIYVKTVLALIEKVNVHGIANITGGGLIDNPPRIFPPELKAVFKRGSWEVPAIFDFIQKAGQVAEREMMRTFNNGIGLLLIVGEQDVDSTIAILRVLGEKAFRVGEIKKLGSGKDRVEFID